MYRSSSCETADGQNRNMASSSPWECIDSDNTQLSELRHTEELLRKIREEQHKEQFRLSYITSTESLRNRTGDSHSPDRKGEVLSDPNISMNSEPRLLGRRTLSAGSTLRTTSPDRTVSDKGRSLNKMRRPDTPSSRTSSGPGTPMRLHKHGHSDFSMSHDEEYEYDDYMPSLPGSFFTMEPVYQFHDGFKPTTPGYSDSGEVESVSAQSPIV